MSLRNSAAAVAGSGVARYSAGSTVLEVTSLTRAFAGHRAIADISMQVANGELVTIVGPSGCGKSTLLRCVAGLLPPTSGQVVLNGVPVTRVPDRLAVVFQDYSRSLYPWLSVAANVALPLLSKARRASTGDAGPQGGSTRPGKTGRSRAARNAIALDALESVGLAGFADRYPWQLSGGMQQRVAIARALACDPVLLLMDEPFGAVDAQTREDLEDLLLRVRAERDITTLLVTHDIDESVYTGDRVIVLTPGPGRIQAEVAVDLPAPRDQIATKELREFARLRAEVSRLIRGTRVPTSKQPGEAHAGDAP
jgi:NitT/TauT family transport system ATP-binding protein